MNHSQRSDVIDIFENRPNRVPVWLMRQAGRYHKHYQGIRKNSDFMTMCKTPELAEEITLGPIEDFKFDAAILFSDLLFPLEYLGLGLDYDAGPPRLAKHLKSRTDLSAISPDSRGPQDFFAFQGQALGRLRGSLPADVSLLGFVGSPFTLFAYAVEGAHKGTLLDTKKGLYDGRFEAFVSALEMPLLENMTLQARAGAQAVCVFDTAAGELCLQDYQTFVVPVLQRIFKSFKMVAPDTKITYYSKMTHPEYLRALSCDAVDCLGIDWRMNLRSTLEEFGERYFIQGNIDPAWLHLPWEQLKQNLEKLKSEMQEITPLWKKWIFGLGHGVTVQTPEENVRQLVSWVKENLSWHK